MYNCSRIQNINMIEWLFYLGKPLKLTWRKFNSDVIELHCYCFAQCVLYYNSNKYNISWKFTH